MQPIKSGGLEDTMDYEQKMAKVMIDLRILRPFYSAIYRTLKRVKSESIDTIGVTTNTLVFNPNFIAAQALAELRFISLHEIAHVALMHPARCENRDPVLWNIACDIYVNAVLSCEFDLKPGRTTTVDNIYITMPESGLYCSSVDIHNDYAESIYEDIKREVDKERGQGGQGGGHSRDGDQQGQGERGQSQDGEDTSGNIKITYSGSLESSGKYSTIEIEVTPGKYKLDVLDNGKDKNEKLQESQRLISDAVVQVEISSQGVGTGTNSLLAVSKKLLESKINWKRILRRYLVSVTSKDSSFSVPDKRMTYQKCVYPGQSSIDDNKIEAIKICIDTSGSISDKDIAYFCGQVYKLLKEFKVSAELIYWDDIVQSTHPFKDYEEFSRVDCRGRGGTNPGCIFKYFQSKTCKIKPKVTLVFTDGYYFDNWYEKSWVNKYRDTIWVMTRHYNKSFKPPFGKLAFAEFESEG